MIRVVYSRRAFEDLTRLSDFLAEKDEATARAAIDTIADAVATLQRHPFIGRPVRGPLRELVISFGRTGYVALYRHGQREVEILSVRHQREAGF